MSSYTNIFMHACVLISWFYILSSKFYWHIVVMQNCDGYEKSHISVGPWGGQCGGRWDDGIYSTVRQLIICHGAAIDSIPIEYDTRGCSVWSEKHGGSGGTKTDKVNFITPLKLQQYNVFTRLSVSSTSKVIC